jgi:uncharacterized membrane protein YfcA
VYLNLVDGAELLFLVAAGVIGGVINSVAGGGTLITFPAALAVGLPAVAASATSSMSLLPGALAAMWAYRRELSGRGRLIALLGPSAAVGGLCGALLLLSSAERVFTLIVPWMVLGATLLIVGKDLIWRRASTGLQNPSVARKLVIAVSVLGVAVYAGYFGAGKNIVLLALLTLLQRMTIHEANALKSAVVAMMTAVSSAFFLFKGVADLTVVVALAGGSVLGSFAGATVARRVNPEVVRYAVVGIGLTLSGALAYQRWVA